MPFPAAMPAASMLSHATPKARAPRTVIGFPRLSTARPAETATVGKRRTRKPGVMPAFLAMTSFLPRIRGDASRGGGTFGARLNRFKDGRARNEGHRSGWAALARLRG